MYCIERGGEEEGGGGRMGRLTLAIILMIPLLSASQQTSPSRASSPTSSMNLKRAHCSDSVYECGLRRCSGGQVERNSDRTLPSVFSCCSGSDAPTSLVSQQRRQSSAADLFVLQLRDRTYGFYKLEINKLPLKSVLKFLQMILKVWEEFNVIINGD